MPALPDSAAPLAPVAVPITHYENFPVASVLCPPHLRAPIAAIYHFARTADDIADEGNASADERLAELAMYRSGLDDAPEALARWPQVFGPLRAQRDAHGLPAPLLHALLDAFVQDTEKTRDGTGYRDHAELLDYCSRSADPVGRLLLHLYGVQDGESLEMSDAICSALQLINFWQDLSVDIPRGRYYLPQEACERFGVNQADILARKQTPNVTKLIAACAQQARASMQKGAPLVHRLPGRAGWELRLVVQGGLRILNKIASMNYRTLERRPKLYAWDYGVMVWRALWM
ncbi:squalene synthase HpnC [Rhodoferax mekongensis]|uniref:Squalene synthase HpnC n=1 Tax=Rhodoferax mekongensis TaxID=3068341 RepID=A0ABZ0AWN7_9BURK|nr:squalene synthase HpnC [Rhodoferax sp. TBRC 17307]WNO04064.1 squalene synthase HpnC [Rhodoferax sp. TBRC 17307]